MTSSYFNGGRMLTGEAQYISACEQFKKGQYKKSFLSLISISNKYSNDLNFLRILSEVQMALKDHSAQIKTLKALSEISHLVDDRIKYMNALLMQNELEQSKQVACTLLGKELSDMQQQLVLKNLIRVYTLQTNFEELGRICEKFDALGFEDAEVNYSRALMAASRSEIDQAISYLRKAVQLDPTFDTGWAALALHHYQKGDAELAKGNLEKALDLNPYNTSALKFLTQWTDDKSQDLQTSLEKVNYHLQSFNFDEELTECHAKLLIKMGRSDLAHLEMNKLTYYFGKQPAL